MRIIPSLVAAVITIILIVVLGTNLLLPASLAQLLSPQHGVWQNAESSNTDYSEALVFPQLKGKAEVYFDDRLVPHVFADHDEDAFFIQGYLHAKFRLWQMEFQTHAAAGRLSEILGDKMGEVSILDVADRYFRRLGMVYAAKRSLEQSEADPETKSMMDAYTAGVNAYISKLTQGNMPLEYKLLGYKPEPWSNLKSALFLKYMSYDLAGNESDFEFTAAKKVLSAIDFETINPLRPDSLDPIIPTDSGFAVAGIHPIKPASADSLYFSFQQDVSSLPLEPQKPDVDNGSNNWAVGGSKTKSGYPILCNDPHLGLNLPSLWYEIHMQTPNFNVYGASFPSAPTVAIGFNDYCAFGFTNAGRDVRDYYEIKFVDNTHREYWFNGEKKQTEFKYEHIRIKDKPEFVDTVAYTVFGPVMFDDHYRGRGRGTDGKFYAVRWKAHDPSNEIKMFYLLNRAKGYDDYAAAIKELHTPGQNCVFAAKNGDIALWCQGEFPAKWKRQGDFIMPGTDSSYMWQGNIPQAENPHQLNPARGFVSSANQLPVDTTYPYYLGGSFPNYRGLILNKKLSSMQDITVADMKSLQTNNENIFATMARPLMLHNIERSLLNAEEKKYLDILSKWNLRNDPDEKGPTVFTLLWDSLEAAIWKDDLAAVNANYFPHESTLLEGLLRDSAYKFVDDLRTEPVETLPQVMMNTFHKVVEQLQSIEANSRLEWARFKDTRVNHLTKLPALSKLHVWIGGGSHILNAAKADHGPSWRMIVSLTPETEAYGVYPGGQNGNPGSKYYDTFINDWAEAKYYPLWVMKKEETGDKRVKGKMTFGK